jgi:hypothetical protein
MFVWAAVLAGAAGSAVAQVPAACSNPANCQGFNPAAAPRTDLNGGGGYASDVRVLGAPQIVADNFFVGATGQITTLCFFGRYSTPAGFSEQTPATESFRITYYTDAGGFPGTVLATFNVGAGGQAGTTLTRVATLGSVPATATNGVGREWSVTHPGVSVTLGQRLWVEIAGTSSDPGGNNRFRWLFANDPALAPFADGGVGISTTDPASYTAADVFAGDMAFCVNVGVADDPRPFAANSRCENAQALALPSATTPTSASFNGNANRGRLTAAPFCKDRLYDGPGVWYTFTGNGRRLQASTCNPGTDFDTVIFVYCGSCAGGNLAGLNCVAQNDFLDPQCAPVAGADASTVAFDTTPGVQYFVSVFGFEGDEGSFNFTLSDLGASTATGACVSDRCPVDIASVPTANVQTEACGSTDFDNCGSANPTVQLGQWYAGNIDGFDRDFWEVATQAPSTWLKLELQVEFPAQFGLLTGACTSTSNGTVATLFPTDDFIITYCTNGVWFGQTDATGAARLAVLTNSNTSAGITCGDNNRYRFRITAAAVGACCEAGTQCEIRPTEACNTAGGGQFIPGGTCSPDGLCVAPSNVVCCRGATCATVAPGSCTIAGGSQAGVQQVSTATQCNAPNNNVGPCCKADYNKQGGVELLDIFAFLTDWFANVPYADFNGQSGVDLLDIFAFLTAWFAGGCS